MINIHSAKQGNLFFTYRLPEEGPLKGTIVLLDGLPSNPLSKNNLIENLSTRGYAVFFPRYEGTWESDGNFLDRSPGEAIIEFIGSLRRGIDLEGKRYVSNKILILGSSFGGGVALDIAAKGIADKICVTSPVISFKNVKGIETLGDYMAEKHKETYRFSLEKWNELIEDKIWNLHNNKIKNPTNILIVFGKEDDQIKEREILEFAKEEKLNVLSLDMGHITLSKIPGNVLDKIDSFFSE